MTEFWKSNPRKYCEICKCWMGDDKMTQQIHENGNRHKANVQNKIRESLKKGRELEKSERDISKSLQKMNEGALQSMMSDLARDPQLAKRYGLQLTDEVTAQLQKKSSANKSNQQDKPEDNEEDKSSERSLQAAIASQFASAETGALLIDWKAAKTPSGEIYYWNSKTRETRWTNPALETEEIKSVRTEKDRLNDFYKERLKDVKLSDSEEVEEKEKKEKIKKSSKTKKPSASLPTTISSPFFPKPLSPEPLTEAEAALQSLRRWSTVPANSIKQLPDLGLPEFYEAPDLIDEADVHLSSLAAAAADAHAPQTFEVREKVLKRPMVSSSTVSSASASSTATTTTTSGTTSSAPRIVFKKRRTVFDPKAFRDPKDVE